jgi:predicted TIM-barrel fold metal-dependent hydrolase
MAVISALPIVGDAGPLSIAVMERGREATKSICGDDRRVFLHGQVNPNVGNVDAAIEGMRQLRADHPIAAWKVYTHVPGDLGWYFDDHDPDGVQCGRAFLDAVRAIGPKIVCVHKGLGDNAAYSKPIDIGPAAKEYPDITFVVYHSGYDGPNEGPYTEATADVGVNRLIASLDNAGVAAHANVYAELGSTWFRTMREPTRAAHVLGKLLKRVGDERVMWGTDSIWYGSPQAQIDAFRTFQISDEFQDRFGYPALTDAVRGNVFGRNAARVYGVDDPVTQRCETTRPRLKRSRSFATRSRRRGSTDRRRSSERAPR